MNESLIKYLAGLLDADGHLGFVFTRDTRSHDRFTVGLQIVLASSEAVDRTGWVDTLPVETGMGSVNRAGQHRQFKRWVVCKRADLEMILPRLIKHMVIKAKHWQWMLDIWRAIRAKPYGEKFVTTAEREALMQACKDSRNLQVGPAKPKKHPTWAWVAGYLDGDGWYQHRKPDRRRYGMHVGAVAHAKDSVGLLLLQKAFGGTIKPHSQSENVLCWERSLSNANRSFALRFLPKVAKHSRLKRHKIDLMIHHHQQRLSTLAPTGDATVYRPAIAAV